MGNDYIQQPNSQTYSNKKLLQGTINKKQNKEEIEWLHPRDGP